MNSDPGNLDRGNVPSEACCASSPAAKTSGSGYAILSVGAHLRLWLVAAIGLTADLWTKHWAFTQLEAYPATTSPFVGIPNIVSFRRSLNPGALFGLGKGLTPVFIAASLLALGFVLFLFWHSGRNRRSLHIALGLVLAGALGNLYDRAYMIADVVKFTSNGKRVTIVGRIVDPREAMADRGGRPGIADSSAIWLGSWPGGEHARKIAPEYNPEVRQQGVVRDFIKMEPHFQLGRYHIELWPWVFNVADALLVGGVGLLMLNFWWERREEKAAQAAKPVQADPAAPA